MNTYIGTKTLKAVPMNRLTYNNYRNWELPPNEDGTDEGYLVEYTDGGTANDHRHAGYISWSPKEVFEQAYKPLNSMDFGNALTLLKKGTALRRTGWNHPDQYIFLLQGSNDLARVHGFGFGECLNEPTFADSIFIRTNDYKLVPWFPSQSDILANDWQQV